MSELPPDALRVLQDARDADEPSTADFRRVRRALAATLVASTVLTTASAAKAAAPAGLGSVGVALKVVAVAVAVTVAGGFAAWQLTHSADDVARSAVAAAAPVGAPRVPSARDDSTVVDEERLEAKGGPRALAAESAVPAPLRRRAQTPLRTDPSPVPAAQSPEALARPRATAQAGRASPLKTAVAEREGSQRSLATAGALPPHSEVSKPIESEEPGLPKRQAEQVIDEPESEVGLMRKASHALSSNAPRDALARLKEHSVLYPNGVLAQERRALRIIALCQLGQRAQARAARERFLSEAPRSPLAAQIRSACGPAKQE